MKNVFIALSIFFLMFVGLASCSSQHSAKSHTEKADRVKLTEQLRLNEVSLKVSQKVTPDIQYHSEEEIRKLTESGIKGYLEKANLLTADVNANSLEISIDYHRRFMGDETPIPSDSLGYPLFDYEIRFMDNDKVLTTIKKNRLQFKGNLGMNLKVMAGALRDKSYELQFIDVLARSIADNIEKMAD